MGNRVLESLGTLAIRVLILFAALAVVASEMAFAQNGKDHWETTSINEAYLKNFVNSGNCYKNENNFLGCIAAINSLLATSTPKKILSNKNIETLPIMKELVQTIQRVQIRNFVDLNVDNQSIAKSWEKYNQTRSAINQSWKSIYALTKKAPLSMETLLQSALSSANKTAFKSKLADSVNSYYRNAIDPHTYIMPSSKWSEAVANEEESTVGAGIIVKPFNKQFILSPVENSAAWRSGVLELDILTHVDGKNISSVPLEEVLGLIRGKENTEVKLSVLRKGQSLDIKIIRSTFVIKNIEAKLLNDPLTNKKVGYIKLNSFMEKGVCNKFLDLAVDLHRRGAQTLILDLRNNGGGLLDEGLCISSAFMNKGEVILTQNDPHTNQIMQTSTAGGNAGLYRLYKNKPLFIIQNAHSASASEVLAGSLVTYGRAIIIGEKSFGKGTVQSHVSRANAPKEVLMMQTVSRFHFASGASNQIVGIQPDILAYSKPDATEDEKFAVREKDEYPNAIVSSKAPTGFPKHGIQAITRCVEKRNLISTEYGNSAVGLDYQLLMAREVASCQM